MTAAIITNFLTGNTLTGADAQRIQTDQEAADPLPTLIETDVAYYRPGQNEVPISWGLLSLEGTGQGLLKELQFLKSMGFAIQRDDRWYIDLKQRQSLYGASGSFLTTGGSPHNLVNLFVTQVLPTYAAMTDSVISVLPMTTYDGRVAIDQHREVQKALHDLKTIS